MRFGAPILFVGLIASLASGASATDAPEQQSALEQLLLADINHPYLPMARYALEQVERRATGRAVRSAILVDRVSLIDPRAVECGDKPFAIIIDLDQAPGVTRVEGEPTGFGDLLQLLRDGGVSIAWISDRSPALLSDEMALLGGGENPPYREGDIELLSGYRSTKQQQRQSLGASHCVLAIAGDRQSDFDELFDYLRDPGYAIRLEAWKDKGWFLLPYPAAVTAANPSPEVTEVDIPK